MDKLLALLEHEWIKIWMISAIAKWLIQARKNDFKKMVFVTDFFLAIIVWYVSWELVKDMDQINQVAKIIFVFVLSLNAVVVVSAFSDKKVATAILGRYLGNLPDTNTKK